jgi:hypothetical protein
MNELLQSIQQEAKDLFMRAKSIPDLIRRLQKIKDPQIRVQIAEELKTYWHRQEKLCHDKTGYYNSCGQWQYAWPSIDSDLATLVQEALAEQQPLPEPSTPIIHQPTTKTPNNMKKESTVNITNNFYGNIGQHISHIDTQHVAFDKDMHMHIEHVENQHQVNTPAATSQTSVPDIYPSFLIFKPDEPNRSAIESLLREALSTSKKKSVVCRKLYQQKDLYNLHTQDDTTKAIIINAWLQRFGLEQNFKALFNRKDFGNYYCKS